MKLDHLFFLSLIVALGVVAYLHVHPSAFMRANPNLFSLTVFNVGEGDATFFRSPNGQTLLIDGGPTEIILPKLGTMMFPTKRDIDIVVLTSPEPERITGLIAVLRRYKVHRLLTTGVQGSGVVWQAFLDEVKGANLKPEIVHTNQSFQFGDSTVQLITPVSYDPLLVRLVFENHSILIAGYTDTSAESTLLKNHINLSADILVVGNRGANTATSDAFLSVIHPSTAIISVGVGNKNKDPHSAVLKRLNDHNLKIFRTDKNGDITIRTDGGNVLVTSEE